MENSSIPSNAFMPMHVRDIFVLQHILVFPFVIRTAPQQHSLLNLEFMSAHIPINAAYPAVPGPLLAATTAGRQPSIPIRTMVKAPSALPSITVTQGCRARFSFVLYYRELPCRADLCMLLAWGA